MPAAHTCTPAPYLDSSRLEWREGYVCVTCGRLLKTSASSIKTHRLCPRRWAFEYILGRRSAPTAVTQLGSDVHDWLEAYLKGFAPPRVSAQALDLASAALPLIEGGVWDLIEGDVSVDVRGVAFRGRIDLFGRGTILDFKTAASPRWALTPDRLPDDLQLRAYVYGLRAQGFDVRTVGHVQLFKDGTAARLVTAPAPDVSEESLWAAIAPLDNTARNAYLQGVHGAEPDQTGCNAYRRSCPHQGPCFHPPAEPMRAPTPGDTMDLQAQLRAIRERTAAPEPPPEPAFNPPDAEPPVQPVPWARRDIDALREVKGVGDAIIDTLRAHGLNTCGEVWAAGDLTHLPRVGAALSVRIREYLTTYTEHPNPRLALTAPAPAPAPFDLAARLTAIRNEVDAILREVTR